MGSVGEKFMNMNAKEYMEKIIISKDSEKHRELNLNLEFKTFFFSIYPKINFYNKTPKKKLYVSKFEAIDYAKDCSRLIDKLSGFN